MKKIILLLSLFAVFCLSAEDVTNDSIQKGIINASEMYFEWIIIGDQLEGVLKGKTSGWISVGFDATTKMKDANYIIGFVDGDKVTLEDHFGHSPIGHKADTAYGNAKGTSNVTLISGIEKDGWTEIKFRIPLNSKDSFDTVLAKGTHKVILAHGPKKNLTSKHKFVSKGEMVIR